MDNTVGFIVRKVVHHRRRVNNAVGFIVQSHTPQKDGG